MAITFREDKEDLRNIDFLKNHWRVNTKSRVIKKCLDIVAAELKKAEKWKI